MHPWTRGTGIGGLGVGGGKGMRWTSARSDATTAWEVGGVVDQGIAQ